MYRSKNNAGPTMERGKNYISSSLKTPSSLLYRKSQILTKEKGIEGKTFYAWPMNSYVRINANGQSKTNKQKKPLHIFGNSKRNSTG